MRVVVAAADAEVAAWLQRVLGSAGLSVAVVPAPSASAPELQSADLLIADSTSAEVIGSAGPVRRMLLVGKGRAVDMSQAMAGGFLDVIVVPSPEDEILGRVGHALDRFLAPARVAEAKGDRADELKAVVARAASALRRSGAERPRYEVAEELLTVFMLTIDSHETAERGTPGHSKRVGTLVRSMALRLGRTEDQAAWLELAARLHDIGLVPLGVPLHDAAPLSLELRRALTAHPRIGADVLGPLRRFGFPVDAVAQHHERTDGSGYPRGLTDVAIDAQIIGAADAFEALTSARPWRPAETAEAALAALRAAGGFAPEIVDAIEYS